MAKATLLFLFTLLIRLQAHILLPVYRDPDTFQFLTTIHRGTSSTPTRLVLDLGGPFVWADHAASSIPVHRCSLPCFKAKAFVNGDGGATCFYNAIGNAQIGNCELSAVNSVTGSVAEAELVEDHLELRSVLEPSVKIKNVIFTTAPASLLSGLATGANGMLGLGKSNIGFLSQISNAIASQRKFSLCLSSSDGVLLLGDLDINTVSRSKVSDALMYTPLINRLGSDGDTLDYFITVKSIRINGQKLPIDIEAIGGTKMSTVVPYTILSRGIYGTFIKAYEAAALSMNMTRAAPVSPFGLCFMAEGIDETPMGLNVPPIDLILQSEMVRWRVVGKNTMVRVGGDRVCVGLVEGGAAMDEAIVVGGLQLVDNLMEFNVGTGMLGFNVMKQSSCLSIARSSSVSAAAL